MSATIQNVAVIGAGTMGAGIAALCAAAGCKVILLDMKAEIVEKSIERLKSGKRPVITDEQAASITVGALDTDLEQLSDADWICEAVIEDLHIKRDLFTRLEAIRKDGSILSTNTSGIPLHDIYSEMPERLRRDIAVTHFFNPVHIMKLVELVPGTETDQRVTSELGQFLKGPLDKGVVNAKDTVNFIGNRIGCYWMLAGLHKASTANISMETVDALMSKPVGLPPTGLYGLIDLIGLDIMDLVGKNLDENLPASDAGRAYVQLPAIEQKMLDNGQLGRKTGGGFYKMVKGEDGSRTMETYDLANSQWRMQQEITLSESHQDIKTLVFSNDAEGDFAWDLMSSTLVYASDLVPEISDDIVNIDRAMRWGFNWAMGPFELIDSIGAQKFSDKLASQGNPATGMLKNLLDSGNDSFYRKSGKEYFTVAGSFKNVPD